MENNQNIKCQILLKPSRELKKCFVRSNKERNLEIQEKMTKGRKEEEGRELMMEELFLNYLVNPSTSEGDLSAYLPRVSKREEAI